MLGRGVDPESGSVSLVAEREFTPLRWLFRRDSGGPFVRLIDNTGGAATKVSYSSFVRPDCRQEVEAGGAPELRRLSGGLFTATSEATQASVILPPFADARGEDSPVPNLLAAVWSTDSIKRLIELAGRVPASLPADPLGAMGCTAVLRTITSQIAGVIGGERWQSLEERHAEAARLGTELSTLDLRVGIGLDRYQALARYLIEEIDLFPSPENRARSFLCDKDSSGGHGYRASEDRFAEFLTPPCMKTRDASRVARGGAETIRNSNE